MALSLWTILQAVLLFTNAFAILNEERFLKKRGITLASATNADSFYGGPAQGTSLKGQLAGFLHACSYLRVPLIFLNTVVILVKTIFG
ncbi:Yos1-like protein [Chloropicon primus]|uniref:Yos1-like protein n=1 Tax=Chloropicon primus TaxID=1764295 RepID=A0A5B8MM58_9CHLO|nr:Yos1-like protein [Chloropicon primus]UPR00566.1 Yos1-like protein [Chloropicon primus]|eukprot:QDZ21351.1 Yos1-like protein [Chloropicon primus]